jgi:HEAT repeat protein
MMTTMDRCKQYFVAFLGIPLLLGVLGCAEFAGLNPVLRKQWREDEKILPSFHTHLKRVRGLEAQAAFMPREEQQRVSRELTRLIREDRNTLLRTAAVRSLSAFPQEMSREGVQVAATDQEPRLREVACAALGRLGDPSSVGMLAALLQNDDNLDVRLAASQQLGKFSDPLAVQALGSALDDSNPALQYRVVQSLERASGRDYGRDLELWRAYVRGEDPPERTPTYAERLRRWF